MHIDVNVEGWVVTSMEYEESVWMKVWGGRGRSALCMYIAAVDAGYEA